MHTYKRMTALAGMAALAAGTILPGVAGATPSATTTDAPSTSCTESTGEVTIGTLTGFQGFDLTRGASVAVSNGHERISVFDALISFNPETNEYEPRMAESLVPNDDYTEWTLTLRDGITFGSGAPLDTAAIEYTIGLHSAEDTFSLYRPQALLIESIDIVDDLTMVFNLTDSWGTFPVFLAASPGMPVDPAVFEERGAEAFALDPTTAGAGAYEVERYVPDEELVLTAKPDYWGGTPCVETLRFTHIASEDARRDAFLNGELDVAIFQTAATWADVREAGYEPHTFVTYGNEVLLINHSADRPGSDVRVRQAMAHALDVDVIDQRMTGGVGLPSTALADETSPIYTEGLEGPQYDPELATQLLDEAKADGYDGKITLSCHNTPQLVEWAIAVQALLQSVGFDVELDNTRTLIDHVTGVYYTGDYDVACLAISMAAEQPWETLLPFLVPDAVQQTRVGYTSDAMVEAMNNLRAAGTIEVRAEALAQVQAVWNQEIPLAITNHAERGLVTQPYVTGLTFTNQANVFWASATVEDH